MFIKRYPVYLIILFFGLLSCTGCLPEDTSREENSPSTDSARSANAEPLSPQAMSVIHRILAGDFDAVRRFIPSSSASDSAESKLRGIFTSWEDIHSRRDTLRERVLTEQQEELDHLRRDISDFTQTDPNDVNEIMAVALRLRDLADGEQEKKAVLRDPFVCQAVQEALRKARDYEKQGQWTDAYIHAYYWLTSLYEDNKDYRKEADRLNELFAIELALKDGTCDDTSRQRHKGIEPEMFLRALHLLEANYVTDLDFDLMIEKAATRCKLLADVFERSKEELAWTADTSQIEQYRAGIETLEQEARENYNPGPGGLIRFFQEVLNLNQSTLQLSDEVMVAQFSEGALSALDPFTTLVWPWSVEDFEKSLTQQFYGIGVEISKATGVLKIVSLLPDTPACRSGVDADDEIIKVNGEETEYMTIFCAVSKITGPKGTNVTLTIRRPSTGEVRDYTITRDKIVVQPIRGWRRAQDGEWDFWVDRDNHIGYVRLTSFTETSGPDLDKILKQLENEGLRGVILDLRYNSGGYLNSAAEVVDLFVKDGVIVKSSPRHGFPTYEIAHKRGTHPDYPLVVLINGSSASASEIVAGALQDPRFKRAVLVGTRSYGKGSVQVVTPYTGGNSQLKYTIAYYHLPSDQQVKNRYQMEKLGRTDWGIAPDIEVKMYGHEIRYMLDIQRENDVLVRADHVNGANSARRHDLRQTLVSDPQLATALLVVQTMQVQHGQPVATSPQGYWDLPIDPNELK